MYGSTKSTIESVDDWYKEPDKKKFVGFLLDIKTEVRKSWVGGKRNVQSGIELFFLTEDYQKIKVFFPYDPYFCVVFDNDSYYPSQMQQKIVDFVYKLNSQVDEDYKRVHLKDIQHTWKHDPNHSQHRFLKEDKRVIIKPIFETPSDVPKLRDEIKKIDGVIDVHEDNILFDTRVMIDEGFRVGCWYEIIIDDATGYVGGHKKLDINRFPEFLNFGWDIETLTRPPQKPTPKKHPIYLISICLGDVGYIIQNTTIISDTFESYKLNAGKHLETRFNVIRAKDEKDLIEKFLWIFLNAKIDDRHPDTIADYNGDDFDFWFLDKRAKLYDIHLSDYGIQMSDYRRETKIYGLPHIDTFIWVKRFSYSAKGEQGAKQITKKFLQYEPIELDYTEMYDMVDKNSKKYNPEPVVKYSGSDAQIPYLLAKKIVNNFLFAVSSLLPITANDVLRKGAGSMVGLVLLSRWYQWNIMAPNKAVRDTIEYYDGKPIKKKSYTGGDVELGEKGVFRVDFDWEIDLDPKRIRQIRDDAGIVVDMFCDRVYEETGKKVKNREQIKDIIRSKLEKMLAFGKKYRGKVLLWHIDVKAMYPNIILTYKIQKHAIVTEEICKHCKLNTGDCWVDKKYIEVLSVFQTIPEEVERAQRIYDTNPKKDKSFSNIVKSVLDDARKNHTRRVPAYTRSKERELSTRFCQKAYDLYVSCVKDFRDFRYKYKGLNANTYKKIRELERAKKNLENDIDLDDYVKKLKMLEIEKDYYYNLQLALKTILNSYYGYLFKIVSRILSIECAGVICLDGQTILIDTNKLIDAFSKLIERDTDGIHTLVPIIFPTEFKDLVVLDDADESRMDFNFLVEYVNYKIAQQFTNHNYYIEEDGEYKKVSKCELTFDLDGPYYAFISFKKKKYIIVDKVIDPRTNEISYEIVEEKGIEKKRKGELGFTQDLFDPIVFAYLRGKNLNEVYKNAMTVINPYTEKFLNLDIPIKYLKESRDISMKPSAFTTKSKHINAAKKMVEMGLKVDAGDPIEWLIVNSANEKHSISDRAVPTALFELDDKTISKWLKAWYGLKWNGDIKEILDWESYFARYIKFVKRVIGDLSESQGINLNLPRMKMMEHKNTTKLDEYIKKTTGNERSQKSTRRSFVRKKKKEVNLLSYLKKPKKKS
jgi:DNA polymerase epsilon subunit 1